MIRLEYERRLQMYAVAIVPRYEMKPVVCIACTCNRVWRGRKECLDECEDAIIRDSITANYLRVDAALFFLKLAKT